MVRVPRWEHTWTRRPQRRFTLLEQTSRASRSAAGPRRLIPDRGCDSNAVRRWIVEHTTGWLGHFRRLTARHDRLLAAGGGFFHLACALLVLRRVLNRDFRYGPIAVPVTASTEPPGRAASSSTVPNISTAVISVNRRVCATRSLRL